MAAPRRRSGLKGASKVRKLIRRMPDDMRAEIAGQLQAKGPLILAAVTRDVPVRTGRLKAAMAWKFFPKSLRLRAGLLTKRLQRDFFYGWILERGRAAKTVRRRRAGKVHDYRVSPIPRGRYDFVQGRALQDVRRLVRPVLATAYERALKKLAGLPDE